MPLLTLQSVRQYYEQNTRLFSFFGGSNKAKSIHRAIWFPGVQDLKQALTASNRLILNEIQDLILKDPISQLHLIDLGCGIGGTLFYLINHIPLPAMAAGLTISPAQARLARNQALKETNRHTIGFAVADYQTVPLQEKTCDLVFSIEAFAHATCPACYLAEAARLLRPGGRLVLIDDFLSATVLPKTETHQRWLDAFRQGWRLPGLRTPVWVAVEAARHGLIQIKGRDLTTWLKLRTLPQWTADLLLNVGSKLPIRHAIWGSMLGSLALQHCLKAGLVDYQLLVFERQA